MTVDSIWISVDDLLPLKGERVLVVCTNPQNHMQRHVSICDYWGNDNQKRKPMWSGHKDVTHWASLPELPLKPSKSNRMISIEQLRREKKGGVN